MSTTGQAYDKCNSIKNISIKQFINSREMSHTNGRHESGSSSNGLSGHTGFTPPEGGQPPLSDFLMQLDDYTPTLPDRCKIRRQLFKTLIPASSVSLDITLRLLDSTPQTLVSCAWCPLLPKSLSQTWQAKHFNMHGFAGEQWVVDQPPGAEREARRGMRS